MKIPIFLIIITILIYSCNNTSIKVKNNETNDSIKIKPVIKLYGYNIDSFNIVKGKIQKNENLSDIFNKNKIPYSKLENIIDLPDSIFNVKHLKVGNDYTFFYSKDTSHNIIAFAYQQNKIDYTVFDFTDSIKVFNRAKKVTKKITKVKGEIKSSLWNAMVNNDLNPMLANRLSDIYAWSIDFFGLQKGDKFKIIYERQFVDSEEVKLGKILYCYFMHDGVDFYAIPFVQDSVRAFFDLEGNSLRKAFLKAPLKFSRISSHFTERRFHPILKIYRAHHGVDYAAPMGTPVHTIGDGKVIYKHYSGGGGNCVKIKHNSVYTTSYMHLSRYANIKVGDYIKQGDLIGYVGKTGLATGPHLDFRVYKNGKAINPLTVKSPPVSPIKKENLQAFDKAKKQAINELNKIK